ncbi:hypothetical protein GGI13_003204 [Coemansia sp. RSA 455]|nr:hypothetical protein GGI13_003204 [Coemansia sp. RSA 455]
MCPLATSYPLSANQAHFFAVHTSNACFGSFMPMPDCTSIDPAFFQDLANLQAKDDLSELAYLFDATLLAFPSASPAFMPPTVEMARTVSPADLQPHSASHHSGLSLVELNPSPDSLHMLQAVLQPDLLQTTAYSNRRRPSCVAVLRLRRNAVFVPRIISDAISEQATMTPVLGKAVNCQLPTPLPQISKHKSDIAEHSSAAAEKKGPKGYSTRVNNVLEDWAANNRTNPYPSLQDKLKLMRETGLTKMQLKNWFCNVRRRKLPGTIRRPKKDIGALNR